MEDRRELGDILISDDDAMKSAQSKKMILVAAAAVILFLMVIFSIYALTREEEQPAQIPLSAPKKVDSAVPLPAAPSTSSAPSVSEENRFQQVPLANDENLSSDDKFERIVREIKAKQVAQATLPTPPSSVPATTVAEVAKEPQATAAKPATKEMPKPVSQSTSKESPKHTSPKSASDTFKNINTAPSSKTKNTGASGGYYVQVGSFAKFSPDGSYAKKIESNGLNFTTQHEVVNGSEITRVLIGPYQSRAEAASALKDIKAKLEPKAFIKHID